MDGMFYTRGRGAGALVFKVGYHLHKKIHVIRVVFQDQAMYLRTSFRGAKCAKLGEKRCFWSYLQILEGHDVQIKKNTCKNVYLGSILIPEKYVFRVCFESPFTKMISSMKYKYPLPRVSFTKCLQPLVMTRGEGVDWLASHYMIDTMVNFLKSHFGQHSSPKQWKIYFSTPF